MSGSSSETGQPGHTRTLMLLSGDILPGQDRTPPYKGVRCPVSCPAGRGLSAESPVIALTTGVVQKRRKTITIFPSGEGRIDSLKVAPLATGVGMQRVIPQVFKL